MISWIEWSERGCTAYMSSPGFKEIAAPMRGYWMEVTIGPHVEEGLE